MSCLWDDDRGDRTRGAWRHHAWISDTNRTTTTIIYEWTKWQEKSTWPSCINYKETIARAGNSLPTTQPKLILPTNPWRYNYPTIIGLTTNKYFAIPSQTPINTDIRANGKTPPQPRDRAENSPKTYVTATAKYTHPNHIKATPYNHTKLKHDISIPQEYLKKTW